MPDILIYRNQAEKHWTFDWTSRSILNQTPDCPLENLRNKSTKTKAHLLLVSIAEGSTAVRRKNCECLDCFFSFQFYKSCPCECFSTVYVRTFYSQSPQKSNKLWVMYVARFWRRTRHYLVHKSLLIRTEVHHPSSGSVPGILSDPWLIFHRHRAPGHPLISISWSDVRNFEVCSFKGTLSLD
jgi:hypothetical protein